MTFRDRQCRPQRGVSARMIVSVMLLCVSAQLAHADHAIDGALSRPGVPDQTSILPVADAHGTAATAIPETAPEYVNEGRALNFLSGTPWQMGNNAVAHITPPSAPYVNFDQTNNGKWTNDPYVPVLSFTLSDAGAGIGGFSEAWDQDPGGQYPNSLVTDGSGDSMFFLQIDASKREGKHFANVRTWNADLSYSGNYWSGWYGFDSQPPAVTLTSSQTASLTYNSLQTLAWTLADGGCGLDHWTAAWDSDSGASSTSTTGALDLPTGTHTLYVHTWDKLGNNALVTFGPFTYIPLPVPKPASILPATALVGTPDLTATISGSGFVPESVALWNGAPLVTTYVDATDLTAVIPAANMAAASIAPITIANGTNISLNAIPFVVANPVPTAASLAPAIIRAGTGAQVTVTGTGFVPSSVALCNGQPVQTYAISSTKVVAVLPAAMFTKAGTAQVSVRNSAPGGGVSTGLVLAIAAPQVQALTLSKTSTAGPASLTAQVTLDGPATAAGMVVSFTSSDPAVTVPRSVVIPSGSAKATIPVTVNNVETDTPATITASSGGVQATATLTVKSPSLNGIKVSAASLHLGQSVTVTVFLSAPAPPGGSTVTLSSSSPVVSGGAVVVPAGALSVSKLITPSGATAITPVTITATRHGVGFSAVVNVLGPILSAVSFSPAVLIGQPATTGTVTLTGPAFADYPVGLSSSGWALTLPPTVVVPKGAKSATISVKPSAVDVDMPTVVTANAERIQATCSVLVKPAQLLSVSGARPSVASGKLLSVIVTLNGMAGPSGTIVSLSSSDGATIPAGTPARVAQGASTTTLTAVAPVVTVDTPITVTATAGTVSKSVVVTVTP